MANISQSGERIVRLLLLLLNTEGVTREQIYQSVPGYKSSSEAALRRCFECDLSTLEAAGIHIERLRRGSGDARTQPALYKAVLPAVDLASN